MSNAENVLDQWRARVGAVPLALRVGLFIPIVALTFYWVATGSGLYALIADATVRHADPRCLLPARRDLHPGRAAAAGVRGPADARQALRTTGLLIMGKGCETRA
jgi:hypothetical protein